MDPMLGWRRKLRGESLHLNSQVQKTYSLVRLNSMLAKKSLAAEKLDEVKIKANILAAFAQKKAQEVTDDAKSKVEDVKEKVKDEL
jgi:protein disulfide-isomerase A6